MKPKQTCADPKRWVQPQDGLVARFPRGVPHAAAVAPVAGGETANYWRAKYEVAKILGDPTYGNTGVVDEA